MRIQTAFAIVSLSIFIPCALLHAQNVSTPAKSAIPIPERVRTAMESAFKDGKNYFIWLVKDTDTFKASRDGMPFPHALIECYCVGNPKQPNPKFKSTIEMVAATSKSDSAERRQLYADADLEKDAAW